VVEHFKNPSAFDWTAVDVRAWEYEGAIRRRYFISSPELAKASAQAER
jgi:hypothetical protein